MSAFRPGCRRLGGAATAAFVATATARGGAHRENGSMPLSRVSSERTVSRRQPFCLAREEEEAIHHRLAVVRAETVDKHTEPTTLRSWPSLGSDLGSSRSGRSEPADLWQQSETPPEAPSL